MRGLAGAAMPRISNMKKTENGLFPSTDCPHPHSQVHDPWPQRKQQAVAPPRRQYTQPAQQQGREDSIEVARSS